MKLGTYPWWPTRWLATDAQDIAPDQISADGVFQTCTLLRGDVIIEVDYNGEIVYGRIGRSVNAPYLETVRRFLLKYSGESMQTIENLDVDGDRFS